MLERENTLGIVVTYRPDGSFVERFGRLVGQVSALLVVDNNSGAGAVSMLQGASTRLHMSLILNSENVGLASALNIGVRYAIARGYEWALLFDQDTQPESNIFEGLHRAFSQFPQKDRLAVIGSNYRDQRTKKAISGIASSCAWRERTVVITSGSLVSLKAYQMIGPFRDEYFIDCVDLEYCLRARSKGFKIIVTCTPLMVHTIGHPTRHRLPWRGIDVSNHSRNRWYYMIRNDVDLAKKYLLREPKWVLTSLWTRFKSLVLLCMFEEDRLGKVWYSAIGLFDGLHSKFDRELG